MTICGLGAVGHKRVSSNPNVEVKKKRCNLILNLEVMLPPQQQAKKRRILLDHLSCSFPTSTYFIVWRSLTLTWTHFLFRSGLVADSEPQLFACHVPFCRKVLQKCWWCVSFLCLLIHQRHPSVDLEFSRYQLIKEQSPHSFDWQGLAVVEKMPPGTLRIRILAIHLPGGLPYYVWFQ
jgi:hypothetical protein